MALAPQSDVERLTRRGIFVGISAWTEPTLIESHAFYPPEAVDAEARLRYYASQFPIAEVDSTFYAPPSERTSELWVQRTPAAFVFDVKSYRLLTHHPTPPASLWRDLRADLPARLRAKPNVYSSDFQWDFLAEALRRFLAAIEPLRRASKLGAVLFQFPRYVYPSRRSFAYLEWLATHLGEVQGAVEFRQSRWMDDEHLQSTLAVLAANRLAYVSVDEPQGLASSVPPIAAATADVAVVRFHGRNPALWEARTSRASQRFAYDYSEAELAEWLPRVESLHERARPVHVIMNNCHSDYAVRAARRFGAQLVAFQRANGPTRA